MFYTLNDLFAKLGLPNSPAEMNLWLAPPFGLPNKRHSCVKLVRITLIGLKLWMSLTACYATNLDSRHS
jgi:hypothetical protein